MPRPSTATTRRKRTIGGDARIARFTSPPLGKLLSGICRASLVAWVNSVRKTFGGDRTADPTAPEI